MEENENIVTLVDEDGQEQDFEIIMTMEMGDSEYAILLPLDAEEDEEAYIFRMEPADNDEVILVAVEDDEEFDQVAAAYEAMLDEMDTEGH